MSVLLLPPPTKLEEGCDFYWCWLVCLSVCLSVCLFYSICLLARLLKKYSTDFDETLHVVRILQDLETVKFLTLR